MSDLDLKVDTLKGIGDKKKKLLSNLEVNTVEDLIYYFPVNYEDRRRTGTIKDAKDGELISLQVTVKGRPTIYRPRRNMSIVKVLVSDGTENAYITFFNQNYRLNQFKEDDRVYISGKVKVNGIIKEFNSPMIAKNLDNSNIGKVEPIYGLTKGLSNNEMIKFVREAIKYTKEIDDLPEYIRDKYDLFSISKAIEHLHFPDGRDDYLKSRNTIAFDELLVLQMGLIMLKNRRNSDVSFTRFPSIQLEEKFQEALPFKLTGAQYKAIKEIEKDMEADRQMNRLVQGDVGSGKTVIAAFALLKSYKSGFQSAMMAPTEILARQHYRSLSTLLEKFNIEVGLLVSNMKAREKREVLEKIKSGQIDVVVGTHALIEDYIEFEKLGLVITDEQHRFGVNQRARLSNKGINPDILVMTATPIPRTLALIVYGDLDITIVDELPPGRKEIKTYGRTYRSRADVYQFVKKQVLEGRQAYVVCPMVEDSEVLDLKSAESVYQELNEKFQDLKIGLLHGQMKAADKDTVMELFKEREIDILVSTTVIEVGVDVPNSNIMVIENAECFGLAQLHQLRGRVGRGKYQSYCILLSDGKSEISKERIKILEQTNDGFIISEKDLELRGPGEFFGFRQHGIPELRVSKLPRDMKILSEVQILVNDIVSDDPLLENSENMNLRNKIERLLVDTDRLEFN